MAKSCDIILSGHAVDVTYSAKEREDDKRNTKENDTQFGGRATSEDENVSQQDKTIKEKVDTR